MSANSGFYSQVGKGYQSLENVVESRRLKEAFSLASFDINSVLRGMQLTLVGGRLLIRRP